MNWTLGQRWAVWLKATPILGEDSRFWRLDAYKNLIAWQAHGDRESPHGWEVDHILPWGGDGEGNLRPLHWRSNVAKSDHVSLTDALLADRGALAPRYPSLAQRTGLPPRLTPRRYQRPQFDLELPPFGPRNSRRTLQQRSAMDDRARL